MDLIFLPRLRDSPRLGLPSAGGDGIAARTSLCSKIDEGLSFSVRGFCVTVRRSLPPLLEALPST